MTSPVERLPHRLPALLIDRLLLVQPGAWAAALKSVSRNDPFTDSRGRWPNVLLGELMAQTAGVAAADDDQKSAVVAKIDRFRCRSTHAGDHLLCVARVVRQFGGSVIVRASVRADRRWVAAAEIVLRFLMP